jgi:hypothetical protein
MPISPIWVPLPDSTIHISYEATIDSGDWQARGTLAKQFARDLRLPVCDIIHHLVTKLSDPDVLVLLEALEKQKAAGGPVLRRDRLPGIVITHLSVSDPPLKPKPPHAADWYTFHPHRELKAPSRAPDKLHLAYLDDDDTRAMRYIASPEFITSINSAGLTGLAYLPIELSRPGEPRPWRQFFATNPLGRGLDHPLVDHARVMDKLTRQGAKPKAASLRLGLPSADASELRPIDAIDHPILRRFHELQNGRTFGASRERRFIREHLPDTDFAYDISPRIQDDKPSPFGRHHGLACSSRAREHLIRAGFLKPADFSPILTVPAAEADAIDLDVEITLPLPSPAFTPAEAAAESARRQAIIDAKKPATTSAKPPSLDETIATLEARLAKPDRPWTPARDDPEFAKVTTSELWPRTPLAWRKLAPLLPLRIPEPAHPESSRWEIVPPHWNEWIYDETQSDDIASTKDLILALNAFGDFYAFRPGKRPTADAIITLWDHETTGIEDQWLSIPALLEHIDSLLPETPNNA